MIPTMLTRTRFDSAALAGLASIAHPMRETGHWRLTTAGRRVSPRRQVDLVVREGGQARHAIDLADDAGHWQTALDEAFLAPGGRINLAARAAADGCHALLFGAQPDQPLWDSRALQQGDGYACTPMRPGIYRIENTLGTAVGRLRVNYPDPRAIAEGMRLAATPVHAAAGTAIAPADLRIDPGQLLVFGIDAPCRLVVTLEAPDDGPPELAAWREERSRMALERVFGKREC
ncbi:hypothetical protein ACFFTM_08530 [Pseudoduganella plicata]|uniref:HutD family protein n=1 Tax=Pseudoduganella plicata TaxID=321984 RepID=A0A4P7BDU3_9BURK|nr:hypothetical protein [Pseudoduganella plicata]QBQ35469.1 hypothetical protein E1742_04285 [Pseudoduganella plicata]GGZ02027.1 hypothetical protein GCM10007388_39730 [Pseudoduganella plicata]